MRGNPIQMTNENGFLLLAIADEDCGLVPAELAEARAHELADELCQIVTIRDPMTDALVKQVAPRTAEG